MSNSPGITWASTKFGKVLIFCRTFLKAPFTFTNAKAIGSSDSSFFAFEIFCREIPVWVDAIPLIFLIFSTILNVLLGSLVLSLMIRSNLPVTGVTDSTLLTFRSWLMVRVILPLTLAKTQLVWSDFGIFPTIVAGERVAHFQWRVPRTLANGNDSRSRQSA